MQEGEKQTMLREIFSLRLSHAKSFLNLEVVLNTNAYLIYRNIFNSNISEIKYLSIFELP